jgi:proline iminopeptidase
MREDDEGAREPSSATSADLPSPFAEHRVAVGHGHELYVAEVGRRDGLPVVFLHGGPGSGCQPSQRALFDPAVHRTVFIDQRGAGRSLPHGRREKNTTQYLVADIESVRERLGIERWLVVGGSWGATLALVYAETHPERVSGLVLRAVFLGTRAELEWAFVRGPRRIRPDLYRFFVGALRPSERSDPLAAYFKRILDPDPAIHAPAAWAWHDTERVLSQAAPPVPVPRSSKPPAATALPATPFMEAHYFSRDCFLRSDQILRKVGRIDGIPGIIIQGRYDLLCPPAAAFALADRWPGSRLVFVEGAGHAMSEPGIAEAMTTAIMSLTTTLGRQPRGHS